MRNDLCRWAAGEISLQAHGVAAANQAFDQVEQLQKLDLAQTAELHVVDLPLRRREFRAQRVASIASSWAPTRRRGRASCRSGCSIAHCASLTDRPPECFTCAASGSNARVYGLDSGYLAAGKAADIVLVDAPDGGTQSTALAAIKHGDIAAIGGVVTAGMPRFVGRSRNTPATTRTARVVK